MGKKDDLRRTSNKRGARKGLRRSTTIARKKLKNADRAELKDLLKKIDEDRPEYRSECKLGERPCPYVSCKYHLYLDVNPRTGSIKLNFPGLEVWELTETCALDVADRGGITLEEVGEVLNLTRERIRQVESKGLKKLREVHEEQEPEGV